MAMAPIAERAATPPPGGRRAAWIDVAALAGVALLPKCPLCVLALVGLWGAVEGSTSATRIASWPVLQVLSAAVLALLLAALARRHGARAAAGAGAMAVLLWASKFVFGSSLLAGLSAVGLGAILVVSRLRRPAPAAAVSAGALDSPAPAAQASGCGCGCGRAKVTPLDVARPDAPRPAP
jgi:hypothetical protein